MRWATSRCWSAAPSSNSSDPTGSDKQPPRPSARTPASAEVRHPAPGHRQPTAPTSRRFPKSCDRQTAPAARRKIPAARRLRRQSAANQNHTRTSQPVAKSPPPAAFGGNPLQTKTIRALRSPPRHPRRTTPDNKKTVRTLTKRARTVFFDRAPPPSKTRFNRRYSTPERAPPRRS